LICNYGHGSTGITLSFGCASVVAAGIVLGRKLLVQRQKRRLPKQPGHREDQASIAIANEVHKSGTRPDAIVIGMLVSFLHAEAWQLLQA
jgi:hypothetical protein